MPNDSVREVRAMILLSMPCPPMPMLMSKEVMDETSFVHTENVPCNSHDLIAHLLNKAAAAKCCGEKLHPRRRVYQQNATKILHSRFDDWKLANTDTEIPPIDISYGFFAEFTRSVSLVIATWMPTCTTCPKLIGFWVQGLHSGLHAGPNTGT
jgi:hypothetical protein